eukprot:jgi/Psemu1/325483/estExt_fgenesh1_pg.C_2460010
MNIMAPQPLVFFVFLTGISMLSPIVVVGFAVPPMPSSYSSSSFGSTATSLRYVAETNYQDEKYYRSRPNDMKVVDVEVETKSQYVYIPAQDMADAVNKAQENHNQDCSTLQKIIDEQRRELELLKGLNQKDRLADKKQYDHLSDNTEMNWGENHDEKMKRTTDRVLFLTKENKRLQAELDEERVRFEVEAGRLQQKLHEARKERAEAEQVLTLERTYFETAINLLEVGLERETKNVKELEEQLMQSNQREFHNNNHQHPFPEDHNDFETWDGPGAYEQQQSHHHHPHDFHHHSQHQEFEEFEPRVRPQHYHPDNDSPSPHEAPFQSYESHFFHSQQDCQNIQEHPYATYDVNASSGRPTTATTTVMGASSIRDDLGMNDMRDAFYP